MERGNAGRDGGGGGGCVVKPVASHIAPARRYQAPYIVGLPLSSLTRFKPVRLAVNTPANIEIPIGDSGNAIASTSKPRLKRGRPIGSKDSFQGKENLISCLLL